MAGDRGPTYSLSFKICHSYGNNDPGVTVPVSLSVGGQPIKLFAKVDTGAEYCLFERKFADALEIDVERGGEKTFSTVSGTFRAYEHELTLAVYGTSFDTVVYFYKDESKTRNVLGRNGWLNRVRLGLVDHDSLVYLSAYDD